MVYDNTSILYLIPLKLSVQAAFYLFIFWFVFLNSNLIFRIHIIVWLYSIALVYNNNVCTVLEDWLFQFRVTPMHITQYTIMVVV